MDAYLAEFKVYVIAQSKPEAMGRVKVWRALALAAGFEPGPGRVSAVPAEQLPASLVHTLEEARSKVEGPARDFERDRAVAALASHFDGDLDFAGELVASMEQRRGGHLPASLAHALADARVISEVPA
jgi:hypothetical protein